MLNTIPVNYRINASILELLADLHHVSLDNMAVFVHVAYDRSREVWMNARSYHCITKESMLDTVSIGSRSDFLVIEMLVDQQCISLVPRLDMVKIHHGMSTKAIETFDDQGPISEANVTIA